MSEIIISGQGGDPLDFEYYDGGDIQLDCEDPSACNFMEAGDCEYPEDNYDCQGNCVVDIDCFGECGGSAVFDACGECEGSNECIHFKPAYLEYSDNPYLAMNIFVTSAELGDASLEMGDEIGIFDGNACVGSAIVKSSISVSNMLQIVANVGTSQNVMNPSVWNNEGML